MLIVAFKLGAEQRGPDYVSKVFHDGGYVPSVYKESDLINRYGKGSQVVDSAGLIRRKYRDPSTGLEVIITSNPDIAEKFRTVDEIRISSIVAGKSATETVESLAGVKLKGVAIGDSLSKASKAAREYGTLDTSKEKIGGSHVERICGFSEGGSSICFFAKSEKVVAMSVGFGP